MASCAANIVDYEIVSNAGQGLVIAECSSGLDVLGCGSESAPDPFFMEERFPSRYVNSPTSCACYELFGVVCYAICGKLF